MSGNKLKISPVNDKSLLFMSSHPPVSRTLKYAQQAPSLLATVELPAKYVKRPRDGPAHSMHQAHAKSSKRWGEGSHDAHVPAASSPAEQYWSARALSAETLLSAKAIHQKELQDLMRAEDVKRSYELSKLAEQYRERHASLEKLVSLLLGLVAGLVALVIYLSTSHARSSAASRRPQSHFTIPILSPFTSVTEHEASVVGSKTIAMLLLMLTALGYFFIRTRFSR
ncbi:hypothetical protein H0H81_010337 [Sphagnurus paluster]|uniref:Uncharacterized protein n=1 Tax=Sphagnurus paluster TaxID=117069 RepID=A0A9P7FVR7_9AGAR|nr:hypothetical protein H0H81_010337 [Sphagnurus paluster]